MDSSAITFALCPGRIEIEFNNTMEIEAFMFNQESHGVEKFPLEEWLNSIGWGEHETVIIDGVEMIVPRDDINVNGISAVAFETQIQPAFAMPVRPGMHINAMRNGFWIDQRPGAGFSLGYPAFDNFGRPGFVTAAHPGLRVTTTGRGLIHGDVIFDPSNMRPIGYVALLLLHEMDAAFIRLFNGVDFNIDGIAGTNSMPLVGSILHTRSRFSGFNSGVVENLFRRVYLHPQTADGRTVHIPIACAITIFSNRGAVPGDSGGMAYIRRGSGWGRYDSAGIIVAETTSAIYGGRIIISDAICINGSLGIRFW